MLPLSLLKTAQRHAVLVELKNGETYNGYLQQCDTWMNLHLSEVICTSKDGQRFFKMPEVYIRGNTIKYISVPEERSGQQVAVGAAAGAAGRSAAAARQLAGQQEEAAVGGARAGEVRLDCIGIAVGSDWQAD
ncbi:hypothetical protein GPECTOR_194g322 [Gonium pectorale]|uniref:U6 snRNA-associated Sm-like protein LSm4 n=1 Tax=Gonium pectorale TaxID=33097 RepID=A0A150FX03_GONPE|nr:hypothetical protein GPECTOR_194g322 [Gonium pectorale]|eukprot:KXZ42154.1 hypothetical protein GPECTOR_194g322 [Gonium pectorale]